MDYIFLVIVVCIAGWYLYRKFSRSIKNDSPSCGCGSCDCQSPPTESDKKKR